MHFLKLVLRAALVVALIPTIVLFLAFSEKSAMNDRFLAAVARNDLTKINQLRDMGVTLEKFCAEDLDSKYREVCASTYTQQNFELAAYVTLGLGVLAIIASIFVPIVFGRNRRLLALLFSPTVRIVTFSVGVAIVLQGLLGAYAVYTIETTAAHVYHPKLIAIVGLAGIVTGFAVLAATFSVFRTHPMAVLARRVDATLCAPLFAQLKMLSGRLGARPPDNVIVGLEPNFFVTTGKVQIQPTGELLEGETLYLSLPLCRTLTVAELDAVIGHELGHFIGQDAAYSKRFMPAYVTLHKAMVGVASAGVFAKPALYMLELCMMQFAKAERAIGRKRELAADEAGSRVSSSKALITALFKVGLYSGIWQGVRRANIQSLESGKVYDNLSTFFALASKDAFTNANIEEEKSILAGTKTAHPIDTHPSTGQRMQALGVELAEIEGESLAVPASSAAALFDNFEKIEQELTLHEHGFLVATGQALLPEQEQPAIAEKIEKAQITTEGPIANGSD